MSDDAPRATAAQALWWTVHEHNRAVTGGPRLRLDDVDEAVVASRRLRVPLDHAALERCLRRVADRHDALRTGLDRRGDELVQVISPASDFTLRAVDLRGESPEVQLEQARAETRDDARRPFDLTGPLVRGLLVGLGEEDSVLVVTVLHAVFDDFSRQLLVDEMRALYAEAMGAPQPRRLAPPVPFRRFSEWQVGWQRDERLRAQHEAWCRRLDGYDPAIDLPILRPRAEVELDTRRRVRVSVPAGAWRAALVVARAERVTPFALVVAALAAALVERTGQDEVAIGAVYGNRRLPWTQAVMGLLASTLVLRASVADDPTFRTLVKRVAADWLAALSAGEVPFDEVAARLGVSRLAGRGRDPAYEVLVNFLVPSALTDDDRPSWMEPWPCPEDDRAAAWAGCLLHVTMWTTAGGALEVRFRYTDELLAPAIVEEVAARLRDLLVGLTRVLDRPAHRLGDAAG